MASLSTVIRITHPKNNINGWRLDQASHEAREEAIRVSDLFAGIACGAEPCSFTVAAGGTALVKASATATCASVVATNTLVVGKTTFTAIANGGSPTAIQFAVGAGGTADADTAAAIAAAINANTTTNKIVSASAAAAVVTVTALHGGLLGNHVAFSSTGGTITCTGSGYLASGAGDDVASTTYDRS